MSKNLDTGEVTPPLPHEEWIEAQKAADAERAKAQASSSRSKSKAAPAEEEDDNRSLYGHKLSVYRRRVGDKTGDERLAVLKSFDGIGDAKAEEIAAALDG